MSFRSSNFQIFNATNIFYTLSQEAAFTGIFNKTEPFLGKTGMTFKAYCTNSTQFKVIGHHKTNILWCDIKIRCCKIFFTIKLSFSLHQKLRTNVCKVLFACLA